MSEASFLKLHPDIQYLMDPKICDVIGQGLAIIYEEQPEKPVEYLAKWLLLHSNANFTQKQVDVSCEKYSID